MASNKGRAKRRRLARKSRQILDLGAVTETVHITISDVDYPIVPWRSMGLLGQERIRGAQEDLRDGDADAFQELAAARETEAAQEILDRVNDAQDEMVRVAVPTLPDSLIEYLTMEEKNAIISAFTGRVPSRAPTATQSPESRSIGENGSPDSSDSMEPETQPSG